jgi:hypothetical protein
VFIFHLRAQFFPVLFSFRLKNSILSDKLYVRLSSCYSLLPASSFRLRTFCTLQFFFLFAYSVLVICLCCLQTLREELKQSLILFIALI